MEETWKGLILDFSEKLVLSLTGDLQAVRKMMALNGVIRFPERAKFQDN